MKMKKYFSSLIVLTLFLNSFVFAMKTKTEKENCSFIRKEKSSNSISYRYSGLVKEVLMGLGVIGFLAISDKFLGTKKTLLLYFGGVGTYVAFKYWPKVLTLYQQILRCPAEALCNAYKVKYSMENELQQWLKQDKEIVENNPQTAKKRLLELHEKNKCKKGYFIRELGECTKEGFGPCVLSRLENPRFRNAFEKKVVALLSEKICQMPKQAVNYVGFATGGMFQDFVIMTKTLHANPHATLNIHFIDKQFAALTDYLELYSGGLLGSLEVNTEEIQKISDEVIKKMFVLAKQKGISIGKSRMVRINGKFSIQKKSDAEQERELKEIVQSVGIKFLQFIFVLQDWFPNAKIKFFAYKSVDDYFEYVEKHKLPYADVVSTVDISDEMSLLGGSIQDYSKLCFKTLEKKPNARNIWLSKNAGKIELMQMSLNEKNIEGYVGVKNTWSSKSSGKMKLEMTSLNGKNKEECDKVQEFTKQEVKEYGIDCPEVFYEYTKSLE